MMKRTNHHNDHTATKRHKSTAAKIKQSTSIIRRQSLRIAQRLSKTQDIMRQPSLLPNSCPATVNRGTFNVLDDSDLSDIDDDYMHTLSVKKPTYVAADLAGVTNELDTLKLQLNKAHSDLEIRTQEVINLEESNTAQINLYYDQVKHSTAKIKSLQEEVQALIESRNDYERRLTMAEQTIAQRTRGGGSYDMDKSPQTVNEMYTCFRAAAETLCRSVMTAPCNKKSQSTIILPSLARIVRTGELGLAPEPLYMAASNKKSPEKGCTVPGGYAVVGLCVTGSASPIDPSVPVSDQCMGTEWPEFELRLSYGIRVLTSVLVHTVFAYMHENPLNKAMLATTYSMGTVLYGTNLALTDHDPDMSINPCMATSMSELQAQAYLAAYVLAAKFYYRVDVSVRETVKWPKGVVDSPIDQEGEEWIGFFDLMEQAVMRAFARVGIDMTDLATQKHHLHILVRRFAMIWFMVPAVDPSWIVRFFPTGCVAPSSDAFAQEALVSIDDADENDVEGAEVLVLCTSMPVILAPPYTLDSECVIYSASGFRLAMPKPTVPNPDQKLVESGAADVDLQDCNMVGGQGTVDDAGSSIGAAVCSYVNGSISEHDAAGGNSN